MLDYILIGLGVLAFLIFILSFLPIWKVPFRIPGVHDVKGLYNSMVFSQNAYSLWSEDYSKYLDTLRRNPSIDYYLPVPFVP